MTEIVAGLIFAIFFLAFGWGINEVFKIRARPIFPEHSDEKLNDYFLSMKEFLNARKILYSISVSGFFLGSFFSNEEIRLVVCIVIVVQFLTYMILFLMGCREVKKIGNFS